MTLSSTKTLDPLFVKKGPDIPVKKIQAKIVKVSWTRYFREKKLHGAVVNKNSGPIIRGKRTRYSREKTSGKDCQKNLDPIFAEKSQKVRKIDLCLGDGSYE